MGQGPCFIVVRTAERAACPGDAPHPSPSSSHHTASTPPCLHHNSPSLLSVLYAQVTRQVRLEEENDELKDTIADLKGEPRPSAQKAAAGQSRFGVSSLRRSGRAAAAKDE